MKKLALLLTLLALILSIAVSADSVPFEKNYVKDGDFVLTSFHAVREFTAEGKDITPLEDACYWLGINKDKFNIKYTGFVGRISNGARYTYGNWAVPNGKKGDKQALVDISTSDERWIYEFDNVKKMGTVLTDCGLPYGVTLSLSEYVSGGMYRENIMQNIFEADDFVDDCEYVEFIEHNVNNFCLIIENNNERYLIFQLEAYPGKLVVEWFNSVMEANPDKRAIVYTYSLINEMGEMYTQHSWSLPTKEWQKTYGDYNTTVKTNLLNVDNAREGDQLWNDALSLHDNLLCVVTTNAAVKKDIVTKVYQNKNGYDVLTVVANLTEGYGPEKRAFPIFMKISGDNRTIDLRYADTAASSYVKESAVTVTLDNIATLPEPEPVTILPKIPYQYNGLNSAYINGYADNLFLPGNNMTKAEACTIFARLLLGTQNIPDGYVTRFADVREGEWYYNAIAYLDQTGFLYTVEGDTYDPNAKITRAEFVELAYLSCILSEAKTVSFKDVDKTNKYYTSIMAAASSGLVNGYGDGTFGPDRTITRAEVVTVINRMLGLVANNTTVNKAKLEKVFNDISGHWAEYQILMASNSNVKGAYHDKINKTAFTDAKNTISFENKHVRVTIAKNGGNVTELINLETGENVVAASTLPAFSYLITNSNTNLAPKTVELCEDGRLLMSFKGGYKAYFIVEVFDNFFTVALDTNLPASLKGAVVVSLATTEEYNYENGSYRLGALPMHTNTNSANKANGISKAVIGRTYTFTPQTIGAKMGIFFGKYEDSRDFLKEISDAIDPSVGLTSKAGGPYALDHPDLYQDYVMSSSNINIDSIEGITKMMAKYSIGQLDVNQSASTFYQGDFNFVSALTEEEKEKGVFGTGAMFKERIADVAHANGVQLGLHTYSSLVAKTSTNILSNPTYQKQLAYADKVYTVRGNLAKGRKVIKTNEDASDFEIGDSAIPWNGPYTRYLLIDEEIILVKQGTTQGFLDVKRGQLGTKPAPHEDGAEIRQLLCHYGMFQPIPGSDLFYHVADLTAKAFNEGDFDMIYLDGFESFARDTFTTAEERYYYYGEFARRVVSQCIKPPYVEYSCGAPTYLWNARGRGGATDHANKAFKQHTSVHLNSNISLMNNYYTATFGWFDFNPDVDTLYKNTLYKTIFRDDLDYMGSMAVAWNISNVNSSFKTMDNPRTEDNFAYYSIYTKLRLAGYFSPEVKEQLKNGEYEYKVFRQGDGSWAFKEMKYSYNRIFDDTDDLYVTGKDINPFGEQTPYVRIEQRYSTLGENEMVVLKLDETADIKTLEKKHPIVVKNIADKITLKVRVYGNGSSTDAILIQLGSVYTTEEGRTDYLIPLNFTGWREFILADADNADYGSYEFAGTYHIGTLNYATFRATPSMSKVNSFTIRLCGECKGVKMDDIRACTTIDAPVKNPSVTVGDTKITFNTELHSGEFVEYYPETGKAYQTYYDYTFNEAGTYVSDKPHVKEITTTGTLTVPAGEFSYTYDGEALTEAPTRARVAIGLGGKTIANPDSWTAPKVDIPQEFIDYNLG